jgi:glycosyltransferase involved in cell wall biosynthesis
MIYTPRLEPFGLAPLEAMACETPVVAIAEGGVREYMRDGINGILVDHDDPMAIGKAILYLLERPSVAREIGTKARKYVLDNWNLEGATERLENCLLRIWKVDKKRATGSKC